MKWTEEDIMRFYDFIEQRFALEDVKAVLVALLQSLFEDDKEKAMSYLEAYVERKNEAPDGVVASKKSYFKR